MGAVFFAPPVFFKTTNTDMENISTHPRPGVELYMKRGAYNWRKYNNPHSKHRKHVDRFIKLIHPNHDRIVAIQAGDGLLAYQVAKQHRADVIGIDDRAVCTRLATEQGVNVLHRNPLSINKLVIPVDGFILDDCLFEVERPAKLMEVMAEKGGDGHRIYVSQSVPQGKKMKAALADLQNFLELFDYKVISGEPINSLKKVYFVAEFN